MPDRPAPTPEAARPSVGIRDLLFSVYFPTMLFSIGQGAVVPIIALRAVDDLGTTAAFAAFVVGLCGIGTMVFDVPAGVLVDRIGERFGLLIASVGLLVVALLVTLSTSAWVYAAAIFVMGCALSIWMLARLSYVSERVSVERRGRALSLMGGTQRGGNVVGPIIGGFVGVALGLEYVFWFFAVLSFLGSAVMLFSLKDGRDTVVVHGGSLRGRLTGVVVDHRRIFLTAGVASITLQVMRAARQAIIPLWGASLGMGPVEVGLIFTLSSFIEVVLVYPVGIVMDRYGRKWAGVPCLTILAVSLILVPFASSEGLLLAIGLLAGVGNGLGSGINMTLGADFAPPGNRGEFLGVWRLVGDVGTAGGPVLLSVLTGVATLGLASVATGGVGIAGALILALLVPEPLRHRVARPDPARGTAP